MTLLLHEPPDGQDAKGSAGRLARTSLEPPRFDSTVNNGDLFRIYAGAQRGNVVPVETRDRDDPRGLFELFAHAALTARKEADRVRLDRQSDIQQVRDDASGNTRHRDEVRVYVVDAASLHRASEVDTLGNEAGGRQQHLRLAKRVLNRPCQRSCQSLRRA